MASSTNLSNEPSQPTIKTPTTFAASRTPGRIRTLSWWARQFLQGCPVGIEKPPQKSLFSKEPIATRTRPPQQHWLSIRKMNGFWWKNWWFSNKLLIFWWKFMSFFETNGWNILLLDNWPKHDSSEGLWLESTKFCPAHRWRTYIETQISRTSASVALAKTKECSKTGGLYFLYKYQKSYYWILHFINSK